MPDESLSLNLSHAVAIALYAFCGRMPLEGAAQASLPTPASLGESQAILSQALSLLQARGVFKPAKAEAQGEYLRQLWQRLAPTRAELEFLAGILKKLGSDA